MDLTQFPVGQLLCDLAQRSFVFTGSVSEELKSWLPDGWSCDQEADGPWRDSPVLVLVAEVYSLLLLGPESPFGRFPSVKIPADSRFLTGRYEPSEPGEDVENWYMDDSDQLQEGVGWEIPGLTAGHALIRFATAIGCVFDSDEMVENLGNFYPERLGRWDLEAPLAASINESVDDGPQSRLYQQLIRESSREGFTARHFLELFEDFADVFGWFEGPIARANVRARQIADNATKTLLGICQCEGCAGAGDEDGELRF